MTPLPWLQFNTMQAPPLPQRPSPLQSGMQLGQALLQRAMANRGRGIEPPLVKYNTMKPSEIARSAGDAANAEVGTPPPVPRRRFPNAQQQQQLDMMR